jgi:hypothetical protein
MANYYKHSIASKLLLATISGAMIFPLSFLGNLNSTLFSNISLIDILIGLIFAILVMVPFQNSKNLLKSLLMIFASIIIYNSMVHLAVTNYNFIFQDLNNQIAITLSGGLGALLTGFAVQLIVPLKLKPTAYPLLIIFGLIAGYIFSYTIDSQSALINVFLLHLHVSNACNKYDYFLTYSLSIQFSPL